MAEAWTGGVAIPARDARGGGTRPPGPARSRGIKAWTIFAAFAAVSCANVPAALERLEEARRLASQLRVDLDRSAAASDRAVMATTDEASAGFASESRQAASAADTDAGTLHGLLVGLDYDDEEKLLAQFCTCFGQYRQLDDEILGLAVENTNLKAQRISFGPAREAAEDFRRSLEAVVAAAPRAQACRVGLAAARAVLAIREIEVLQAPHIAAEDDPTMARLEAQMATDRETAERDLGAVARLAPPGAAPQLRAARAAFARFGGLNDELVRLSRRNSNVRSLALSLGRKRNVTAECDAVLASLQEKLAGHGSKATR